MSWVSVEERLPDFDVLVPVHGDYTPEGTGKPRSYRRQDSSVRGGWLWSSTEWRGTVAVTYWWES